MLRVKQFLGLDTKLVLFLFALVTACSSGGGGDSADEATGANGASDTGSTSADVDSAPLPTGAALDTVLRATLAQAGVTALRASGGPGPGAGGPAGQGPMMQLGQALFFDKELSGNRDISCATCHHSLLRTGDDLSLAIGTGGIGFGAGRALGPGRARIPRNSPELFNRALPEWETMFWDGRVAGSAARGFTTPAGSALPAGVQSVLAAQAFFPVTSPEEMRGAPGDTDVFGRVNELAAIPASDLPGIWSALMQRLLAFPGYVDLFTRAYPDVPASALTFSHAANAMATFQQMHWTLLNSPWDRYVSGDNAALPEDAKRGAMHFYGKAGCAQCHSGNLLTDQKYHNIAVPQLGPGTGASAPLDHGRAAISGRDQDRFAFRTPPLRNVSVTGPWMHNGAYTVLDAAVRHHLDARGALTGYDASQLADDLQHTTHLDPQTIATMLETLDPLVTNARVLTHDEFGDVMAFLQSLTDPAALDLRRDIPASVPSGLPLTD